MLRWFAVALLVLLPGAQACSRDAMAQLSLEFPEDGCSRQAPDACPPVPSADAPLVVAGELVWSWEVDACALDVVPSASPVHVSFEAIERANHGWLTLTVEPREIFIPVEQQWDLTDDGFEAGAAGYRAEERYPIQVSLALVGEPSPAALDSVAASDGLATLFLKASSSQTTTFLASFALEQFQLDARPALAAARPAQQAPGLPLGFVGVALLALALARR